MNVTRVKEDVTAISYELLRRSGLSVKFKVKTYYEGINKQEMYYYTSYVYNNSNKKRTSISIVPKSYIQFDFGIDDGKNLFFLSEVYKNRLVRKLTKITQLLDAYDNREIDIIKVNQSGTHIDSKIPRETKISLGSHFAIITVEIREDKSDIGVGIQIDNMKAVISLFDFLDLMIKLNSINYTDMSMKLLNHIGPPEIGSNEIDFRPSKIISTEDREQEFNSIVMATNSSELKNLASPVKPKSYNRTNW